MALNHHIGLKMTTTDHKGLTWPQYNQSIALWRGENLTPEPTEPLKELKIAHFNDVYKVSDQSPADDKINVSKFATLLSNVRKAWKASGHGDGLTIFSGDIFSPSPHSTISRGRHMVHVANALKIDIGVIGNHEFDFGVHQLFELIKETKFPWLLSNIIDKDTGTVPVPLKEYHVLETSGVRVGFVGLVEKGWLETIVGLPASYEWQSMTEIGLKLSQILRDPSGPHKCDLVIALTHSRVPDDIRLARELFALSPKAQAGIDITSKHGVDLLLGGHDHFYWISKGVSSWEKYNLDEKRPEAEGDQGDTLVVKSGTDFQDLSEITLGLKATPAGSVRRMIIASIKGKRCITSGDLADDQDMVDTIQSQFANINASLPMPICFTEVDLPLVSRTEESVLGNWIADCLKPVYDDVLRSTQRNPVDGVLILTGDIRGGNYPKGPLTLENLLEIVPYGDSMIVLEISGKDLWTAVESSLSKYPKTEGRFPAISGFRVDWKSKNPVGSRVQGIWLQGEPKRGADGKTKLVDKEEVGRSSDRKYTIAVGYYMYQGGDGYDVLKNQTVLLGEENGDTKANLVRKFLLGETTESPFYDTRTKGCI
ncbi:Metallo-dependent phosphatase [Cristinia sonorae]|uniref:Metallo-dependent phosphatase n=1 Tax=Cristinia sonorae TaxID=1940300 RepID=A0A8K0UYT9_9AGAR|nr:Metallo-dependent phosphatase [Cristinia sonorae]